MPLTILLLGALGGLGLFILGMKTMSEGLLKLTGAPLRHKLERFAGNRVAAILFGTLLSSLLQSSGAAAIITVGFVNAGLISLYQSLAILLGTSIGTTIAIQFIAFKFFFFSPPAIFAGMMLRLIGRKRRVVYFGEVVLGIGLLFFGLQMMETNFAPLEKTAIFQAFHSMVLTWKINAVLLGAFLTVSLQSGSAAIAVVMSLAGTGIVSVESGAAMAFGECIGTSVMAVVGTIGGTIAGRRSGIMYFVITVAAVGFGLLLFRPFMQALLFISPHTNDVSLIREGAPRTIANAHTLFSLLIAAVGLPLTGLLSRVASSIIGRRSSIANIEARPKYLDEKVLNTPSIAFLQGRNELKRMTEVAVTMYERVAGLFDDYNTKVLDEVRQLEDVLDILQRDISSFLVKLLQQPVTPYVFSEIPEMLKIVEILEHTGDTLEMISDCLRRKKEDGIYFSDDAMNEIGQVIGRVGKLVAAVSTRLLQDGSIEIDPRNELEVVSALRETAQESHIRRLVRGECTVAAGLLYGDITGGFCKIAENCLMILESERKNAQGSN